MLGERVGGGVQHLVIKVSDSDPAVHHRRCLQ